MTTSQLKEILKSNILVLASADASDIPGIEDHIQAGANVIMAPACVRMDDEDEAVLEAVFESAGEYAFVAGQIAVDENLVSDDETYDTCYRTVLEQAVWLDKMEVSMIFLTGFHDVRTAKCAVYAAREATSLPLCVGMCIGEEDDAIKEAVSMLIALQALDVCAVGCTGMFIDDSLSVLSELQAFTTVPLFAINEPGRYLEPEDYGDYISSFTHQKCAILGLTSGSSSFTAAASKGIWQLSPLHPDFPMLNAVCSRDEVMFLDFKGKVVSQNKQILEIKTEKEEELTQALTLFNRPGAAPVCFNIRDIDLLEYAITHYAGRPAVKSDEYGEITAKELGALILKS